ncbi:Uncharacterised protein [Amycolatopsis camponoti]|uniref:Uncharacterized protein n=1 Tax=Amycolatopsis camponoti TaxID=2606593 RepID=A0A6I8LQS9_9PSEU|nr:Uncharacterised protein [Amycolatopsis camponoti]
MPANDEDRQRFSTRWGGGPFRTAMSAPTGARWLTTSLHPGGGEIISPAGRFGRLPFDALVTTTRRKR